MLFAIPRDLWQIKVEAKRSSFFKLERLDLDWDVSAATAEPF